MHPIICAIKSEIFLYRKIFFPIKPLVSRVETDIGQGDLLIIGIYKNHQMANL